MNHCLYGLRHNKIAACFPQRPAYSHSRMDNGAGGRSVTYGFGGLETLIISSRLRDGPSTRAQGSEYPSVVIPVMIQHYAMLQRNLLYTRITRGKTLVALRRSACRHRSRVGENCVGLQPDQFFRRHLNPVQDSGSPSHIHLQVAAFDPTNSCSPRRKAASVGLRIFIAPGHQGADVSQPSLLRLCGERPRRHLPSPERVNDFGTPCVMRLASKEV
jgi:UvrD-like helicase C-terminal domain